MGVCVLVLGRSGAGKSTSLRNFAPGEIGVFDVIGKPLPFRERLDVVHHATYTQITQSLAKNARRAYAIDDAGYLMTLQNFALASQTGYGKYTTMAVNFAQLLEAAAATNDDTIVYFLMHPDFDDAGRMRPKTIGKMLDNQFCVEGMFPVVLVAERGEDGYHFATQTDGQTCAKSPIGMFGAVTIDNDLKAVDAAIRDYWGLAALRGDDKEDKDAQEA